MALSIDDDTVTLRINGLRPVQGVAEQESQQEFHPVQVAITCKHGSISEGVHDHITQKAEKLLTFFERVTAISVTVAFDKDRSKVEILVDAEHKHNFVSAHEGDDVIHTFDQAYHKMEHQIKKYKEKIQDHRRDPATNEVVKDPLEEASDDE